MSEKSKEKNNPWIERYRPKVFSEIVGNEGKILREDALSIIEISRDFYFYEAD